METTKWKDKWFYYKLVIGILILGAMFSIYLNHMILQTWLRNVKYPFSPVLFQGQFFSFFTYQSNLMVGIWFLICARYHNQPKQWSNRQNVRLAITCYITVTCLTWVCLLLPGIIFSGKPISAIGLITGIFFHVIAPTSMIIYTYCHIEPLTSTIRGYYHKSFFLYWIYPWLYTLFLIFRIALYANDATLQQLPFVIVYPYAPTFKDVGGFGDWIGNFISTFIIVIGFFIIVHILFIFVNLVYLIIISKVSAKRNKQIKT